MDSDDPERRIAELERQLVRARAAQDPPRGGLTLEHVRSVAFSKPPRGKRGYNETDTFVGAR